MPTTRRKTRRGRPKGSKNKPKPDALVKKKVGRPKGSKNKPKVVDEQSPVLEPVVNDSTSNLFTINEHELFNIISDEDPDIKNGKIKTGTVFGLSVEGVKNGRIYFSLKSLKRSSKQ